MLCSPTPALANSFPLRPSPDCADTQYRLRVDDIRVFYDVTETQVQIFSKYLHLAAEDRSSSRGMGVPPAC